MSFRRNDRRTFSRKTMQIAYARTKDGEGVHRCQGCTAPLVPGKFIYDHVIPWEISRDSSIGNCQLLCAACDAIKTPLVDIPVIAKSNRQRDRHIGAVKSRHPMQCGRASKRTKTFGHGVQPRLTQAQKHARTMAARRIG